MEINLSQGKIARVDKSDYVLISKDKWTYDYKGYAYRKENGKSMFMHRVILGLVFGDGKIVDHINGNGLDNRRSNLQICSQAVNIAKSHWDKRMKKKKYSKHLGVTFDKNRGMFFSQKRINGKRYWGGLHKTEEGALKSYKTLGD